MFKNYFIMLFLLIGYTIFKIGFMGVGLEDFAVYFFGFCLTAYFLVKDDKDKLNEKESK